MTSDSFRLSRGILLFGGWIPIGIVAIVAGIVVAFISGGWLLILPIALGGTTLGYLAALGASYAFDNVGIRWLRLGRPDESASAASAMAATTRYDLPFVAIPRRRCVVIDAHERI